MKSEFTIPTQREVDTLADVVLSLVEDLGFQVIPRGGGRSITRPIDYGVFDLESRGEKFGRFKFELKDNVYRVTFESDVPDVYDRVTNRVAELYPGIVPAAR